MNTGFISYTYDLKCFDVIKEKFLIDLVIEVLVFKLEIERFSVVCSGLSL